MTHIVDLIVRKLFQQDIYDKKSLVKSCKLAIKFNRPNCLHKLLECMYLSGAQRILYLTECITCANALEREGCKSVIELKNRCSDVEEKSYVKRGEKRQPDRIMEQREKRNRRSLNISLSIFQVSSFFFSQFRKS